MPAKKTATRKQKTIQRLVAKAIEPSKNFHRVFVMVPGADFPQKLYFPIDKPLPNEVVVSVSKK